MAKITKQNLMKKLKFARALWKSVKEFLAKTSVHSYHYLVEPNRHKLEKLMWCVLHLVRKLIELLN